MTRYDLQCFDAVGWFVSDIAIFVLKRDVKLQLTNCCWLDGRKGIRPVKIWGDGAGEHWLFKATDFGTNRKLIYDFPLVINTN